MPSPLVVDILADCTRPNPPIGCSESYTYRSGRGLIIAKAGIFSRRLREPSCVLYTRMVPAAIPRARLRDVRRSARQAVPDFESAAGPATVPNPEWPRYVMHPHKRRLGLLWSIVS